MYFILSMAVANFIASIPITIYGLGTRDVTMISLFSLFGVPSANILGLSIFWFGIIWLFPSIIGAIVTLNESRNDRLKKLSSKSRILNKIK
jgi:uncharacterized membrane protein YbhN (UPF0104 family)